MMRAMAQLQMLKKWKEMLAGANKQIQELTD